MGGDLRRFVTAYSEASHVCIPVHFGGLRGHRHSFFVGMVLPISGSCGPPSRADTTRLSLNSPPRSCRGVHRHEWVHAVGSSRYCSRCRACFYLPHGVLLQRGGVSLHVPRVLRRVLRCRELL